MIDLHFPTCVYHVKNIVSEDYHNRLVSICENVNMVKASDIGWDCDIKTSYSTSNILDDKSFDTLKHSISQHVEQFCLQMGYKVRRLIIGDSWVNKSVKGQFQERHTHPNSNISAIYYLKAPKGSGDTVFRNPYEKQIHPIIKEGNPLNTPSVSYEPEKGKLLLFESHVPHLVKVNKTNTERMTLAANFKIAS